MIYGSECPLLVPVHYTGKYEYICTCWYTYQVKWVLWPPTRLIFYLSRK